MDYEEIDAWYEEQKQELVNEYVKALEEKKDRKEIEQEFKNKMKKIHKKYKILFDKNRKNRKTSLIKSLLNKIRK